jgi:hypothetical protein
MSLGLRICIVLSLAGCGDDNSSCHRGTVKLLLSGAAGGDRIDVNLSVDGNPAGSASVTLNGQSAASVEIVFPGNDYPAGLPARAEAVARQSGAAVALGDSAMTLAPNCTIWPLTLHAIPAGSDLAVPPPNDLATADATGDFSAGDLSTVGSDLAASPDLRKPPCDCRGVIGTGGDQCPITGQCVGPNCCLENTLGVGATCTADPSCSTSATPQ